MIKPDFPVIGWSPAMSMESPSVLVLANRARRRLVGEEAWGSVVVLLSLWGGNGRPHMLDVEPQSLDLKFRCAHQVIAVRRRESLEYPGASKMAADPPPAAADSCNRSRAQGAGRWEERGIVMQAMGAKTLASGANVKMVFQNVGVDLLISEVRLPARRFAGGRGPSPYIATKLGM